MVGVQRAAIAAGNRADAFLDAGAGQEMELDVGRLLRAVAPPEAAGLDDVGGHRPLAEQRVFETGDRLPALLLVAVDAVRPVEFGDDIDIHVIVQVLADAGQVVDHLDAVFAEMRGRADAGQHQQFGRADGAGGDDHLALGAQQSRCGH